MMKNLQFTLSYHLASLLVNKLRIYNEKNSSHRSMRNGFLFSPCPSNNKDQQAQHRNRSRFLLVYVFFFFSFPHVRRLHHQRHLLLRLRHQLLSSCFDFFLFFFFSISFYCYTRFLPPFYHYHHHQFTQSFIQSFIHSLVCIPLHIELSIQ